MVLEFMQNINSPSQNNPEKIKDLWERVAEEALLLLDKTPDFDPQLKAKAQSLIEDPSFKKRIKDDWDKMTLKENVVEDPGEQERLWARGLKQEIISKLSAPNNR